MVLRLFFCTAGRLLIGVSLLYNHLHTDWRDQIARIRQPTLIIGGRKSIIPWQSLVWINQSIPNSLVGNL